MELEPKMHIPFLVLEQNMTRSSFLTLLAVFSSKNVLGAPRGEELRKHRPAAGGGTVRGGRAGALLTITPAPAASWHQGCLRGKRCSRAESDDGRITVVMQRVT